MEGAKCLAQVEFQYSEASGQVQGGEGFVEGGFVFDVEADGGLDVAAEDLAGEAGEDAAGAELDEVGGAAVDEELEALDPADGGGDLADEAVADVGAAGEEAGVDVARLRGSRGR